MPIVPAICPKCGTVFPSGIGVGGITRIVDCKSGPCPKCGGMGDILDGFYLAISESLVEVWATDFDQLKTLIEILIDAQRNRLDAKIIADLIAATLPKLKAIADYIRKNKEDVYKVLGLLIATLAFVYTRIEASKKGGLTEREAQLLIDEAIAKACKTPQQQAEAKKQRKLEQRAKLAKKAKEKQRKQQRRR